MLSRCCVSSGEPRSVWWRFVCLAALWLVACRPAPKEQPRRVDHEVAPDAAAEAGPTEVLLPGLPPRLAPCAPTCPSDETCVAGVCVRTTPMALGTAHGCAIFDGKARCWESARGETPLPWGSAGGPHPKGVVRVVDYVPPVPAASVAIGSVATCVLLVDGSLRCWSGVFEKCVGATSFAACDPTVPAPVDVAIRIVRSGYDRTCVLQQNNAVSCWDEYKYSDGWKLHRKVLPASWTVTDLVVADAITCVLLADGRLACWGRQRQGGEDIPEEQLLRYDFVLHRLGDEPVRMLASQGSPSCALLGTRSIRCWGRNFRGELGRGDRVPAVQAPSRPEDPPLVDVDLGTDRPVRGIAAGVARACAWFDDGRVKCWGENQDGRLGLSGREAWGLSPSDMGTSLPFVDLGTHAKVKVVASAYQKICAWLEGDVVACWGDVAWDPRTRTVGQKPSDMGNALPRFRLRSVR